MKTSKILLLLFMHAGVSETVVLNMSTLAWSVVTTVQGRVPLASEVIHILEELIDKNENTLPYNALPYNFIIANKSNNEVIEMIISTENINALVLIS